MAVLLRKQLFGREVCAVDETAIVGATAIVVGREEGVTLGVAFCRGGEVERR